MQKRDDVERELINLLTNFIHIHWMDLLLGGGRWKCKHSAHTQTDVIGEGVKHYALNQTDVTKHSWCDLVINACFVKNEEKK